MSFTSSNKSAFVYLFKVNNGNTSTMSVTTYFTNTLHFTHCSSVSIVDFKHVNAGWEVINSTHVMHIITYLQVYVQSTVSSNFSPSSRYYP